MHIINKETFNTVFNISCFQDVYVVRVKTNLIVILPKLIPAYRKVKNVNIINGPNEREFTFISTKKSSTTFPSIKEHTGKLVEDYHNS